MKKILISLLFIFLFAITLYSSNTESSIALQLFNDKTEHMSAYFSDSFLQAVPAEKIVPVIALYRKKLGKLINADQNKDGYTLRFENGNAPCKIFIDTEQKINGFWLGPYSLSHDSFETLLSELRSLENDQCATSLCIMKNGTDILFSHNKTRALGVGSAYKLYILKALDSTLNKHSDLKQTIILTNKNKAYPTSTLINWPEDTPLTVKTLANLMISVSDNTATDMLIDHLGRHVIETFAPETCCPLLKIVELFNLKWRISDTIRKKYIHASLEEKYEMLKSTVISQRSEKLNFSETPAFVNELGWHIDTEELCRVIYELRNNSSLYINSGLVQRDAWHKAGYKGGSVPGVLNYTHVLQKEFNSPVYSVSITINNIKEPINKNKFNDIASRIISIIEKI